MTDLNDLTPEQLEKLAAEKRAQDPAYLRQRIEELEQGAAQRMYGNPGAGGSGSAPPLRSGQGGPGVRIPGMGTVGDEKVKETVYTALANGDGLPNRSLADRFAAIRIREAVDQAYTNPSYR